MGTRALILAAGRGSRLGDSAHEVPKCLLEIGRRRLIEHQIDALADAGVGPVHLVVGYASEEIREIVGMRADYIVNTRWEQTNSLYSFTLARNAVQDDVILLNSDVLFAPEIIGRLLDHPGDAVAIDTRSGDGREQMKVEALDGRLLGMSKNLPADRTVGENVGVLKLTAETARVAFERAAALVEQGRETGWVGEATTAIARERDLRTVDVAGLPWVEIDFATDLQRARKEVWPQIQGGGYRRHGLTRAAAWVLGAVLVVGAIYAGATIRSPGVPTPTEWESLAVEDLKPVQVDLQSYLQDWWLLPPGGVARADVVAPGSLRIESRLLDPAGEQEPYILELSFDGERLDWYKLTTRPSAKATHPQWVVGHKKRFMIDLDRPGPLELRLVAPHASPCLVRFRQAVEDSEE